MNLQRLPLPGLTPARLALGPSSEWTQIPSAKTPAGFVSLAVRLGPGAYSRTATIRLRGVAKNSDFNISRVQIRFDEKKRSIDLVFAFAKGSKPAPNTFQIPISLSPLDDLRGEWTFIIRNATASTDTMASFKAVIPTQNT